MAIAEPNKGNQTIQMQRKNDSGVYENYYPNTVMSQIEGSIQMKAKVNITANVGDNIAISGDSTQTVTIADSGTATIYLPYGDYTFTNNSNNFTVKLIVDTIKTYEVVVKVKTLEEYSWAEISEISQSGDAPNKFNIGDIKKIALKGSMYGLALDMYCYVYILDFNHDRSSANGAKDGITFGTFKIVDSNNIDVLLCYNPAYAVTSTRPGFCISFTSSNYPDSWGDCDMRYTILGSTNAKSSDASSTTATSPVSNTLMSCLPSDLRAVMKPMYIYTNYYKNSVSKIVGMLDYLPLLSDYEILGKTSETKADDQTQYAYYKNGNSVVKYQYNNLTEKKAWWTRTLIEDYSNNEFFWFINSYNNDKGAGYTYTSWGVAPMFKV